MSAGTNGLREDFLLSVCFVGELELQKELSLIRQTMEVMKARFQYWEIVFVAPESIRPQLNQMAEILHEMRNLRILLVSNDVGYYQRRKIAAAESLGDVTLLTAVNEVGQFDLCALAERVFDEDQVIIAKQPKSALSFRFVHFALRAISANQVRWEILKTIGLPRSPLNQILNRSSAALDLRYPPKNSGLEMGQIQMIPKKDQRKSAFGQRYQLSVELVTNATDQFLRVYAGFAILVNFSALAYGIYAVLVLLIGSPREGWFSTAFIQAGTVFFVACGMAILSHAMRRVIKNTDRPQDHVLVDELSNLDFFKNAKPLNITDSAKS